LTGVTVASGMMAFKTSIADALGGPAAIAGRKTVHCGAG
jgi:hypothetical protein